MCNGNFKDTVRYSYTINISHSLFASVFVNHVNAQLNILMPVITKVI